jgi:type IX secretion system PorP/SprF family membrane protein
MEQNIMDQLALFINHSSQKMRTLFNTTFLLVVLAFGTHAQQEYQFSNTAFNPFLLNPAAGGLTDVAQFDAIARTQWLGYDGAPRTFLMSGASQLNFSPTGGLSEFNVRDEALFKSPKISIGKSKHVVGGKLWTDVIGPFSKTSVQLSYAYHMPLSRTLNIGAGIGLGYSLFRLDPSKVVLYQADDPTYNQFLGNTSQQSIFDAQAGLVLYGKNVFLGLSTTQAFNNQVRLSSVALESNFNRHYFIVAKYRIDANDILAIEPLMVFKFAKHSPMSVDFGARFTMNQNLWFGMQYRTNNALVFQFGGNIIKNLYLNYSYEQSVGRIATAGNGTHEIGIGYYLGKNRNVDKELRKNKKEGEAEVKEGEKVQ